MDDNHIIAWALYIASGSKLPDSFRPDREGLHSFLNKPQGHPREAECGSPYGVRPAFLAWVLTQADSELKEIKNRMKLVEVLPHDVAEAYFPAELVALPSEVLRIEEKARGPIEYVTKRVSELLTECFEAVGCGHSYYAIPPNLDVDLADFNGPPLQAMSGDRLV